MPRLSPRFVRTAHFIDFSIILRQIDDIHSPRIGMDTDGGLHFVQIVDEFFGEQRARRAEADDFALLDGDEAVAVERRDVEVVDRGGDGEAESLHDVHNLELIFDVQVIRRLVEHHAFRLLCERPRENHALLLAARETRETALLELRHADHVEGFTGDFVVADIVALEEFLMRGAPHEHDVEHGEVETVEVVLCDDGEAPRRLLIGKIVQRAPVKTDCTLVRMLHAVDALEEHALAAAVRADDAEEFLIVQAEIHPFENLRLYNKCYGRFYESRSTYFFMRKKKGGESRYGS